MRVVKLGLISIVGLFLVIFLLSLLIPSKMRVSRAITINSSFDTVIYYLKDIRQWQRWNGFLKNDGLSNIKSDSLLFLSSEMEVKIVKRDSVGIIQTSWKRVGQEAISSGFGVTIAEHASIVQWYFDFKVKWYPWEKFGSIVFDKELGPLMEHSLDQLKKMIEKTN